MDRPLDKMNPTRDPRISFVCDRLSVYRVPMGAWQPNSRSEVLEAEATALDIRSMRT